MKKKTSQRNYMRELVKRFGANSDRVVREYAAAEMRGDVQRNRNSHGLTPEQYARALWNDAVMKGWIRNLG